MATKIKPMLSSKNKYRISKHRHYELKHFCLQYPEWKKACSDLDKMSLPSSIKERPAACNLPGDPTAKKALINAGYYERIRLVEEAAAQTDSYLNYYILKGVTEGLSYAYLKTNLDIPCARDTYYDRYRRFFWILDKSRD